MQTGINFAYNVSRNVLLSKHVIEASEELDPFQFLALLLNGPGLNQQSAVWLKHFAGTRELPSRLFTFDIVYLGKDDRILEVASVGPATDFPPVPEGTTSLLFLPDGKLEETASTRGNVVRICTTAELAPEIEFTSHPFDSSFSSLGSGYSKKRLKQQAETALSLPQPRPSEFVFEPFIGSLVHLPTSVAPAPQSSEYFLTSPVLEKPFSALVPEPPETQFTEQVLAEQIPSSLKVEEEMGMRPTEPETELSGLEEIIAAPLEQQMEPASTAALLDAARDAVQPESASIEEPLAENAKPVSRREIGTEIKNEKLTSAARFLRWIEGRNDIQRRRSRRISLPGLVAFYWSGGAPKPHEIVNISKTGFYLRTKDVWLPDTLVRMTLERPDRDARESKRSIGVLARVVRIEEDGVGHEFVTTEALVGTRRRELRPERGTRRKELEAFLDIH